MPLPTSPQADARGDSDERSGRGDRTPIRFAALVGRELGGFSRPPGYDE